MNYYIYFVKCGVYRKGNEDEPISTFRCNVRLNGKESKKSATRNRIFKLIKKCWKKKNKSIKVISFDCIGVRYLRTDRNGVALPDPQMGDKYVVFID